MSTQSMTAEDRDALQEAAELYRPLARAAAVGRSNALGYAVFGGLTILLALFGPDVLGLTIGALVAGVGAAQLRAIPRLKHGDPTATRALARNELLLMGGIIVYAVLKLTLLREDVGAELAAQGVDGSGLGLNLHELADSLNTAFYATVMAVTLLYQGGLARYYARRRPMAERYLAEAPEWTRELVESMG